MTVIAEVVLELKYFYPRLFLELLLQKDGTQGDGTAYLDFTWS